MKGMFPQFDTAKSIDFDAVSFALGLWVQRGL